MNYKKELLVILFLAFFLVILLTYREGLYIYFQQDEWHSFGWMLRAKESGALGMIKAAFSEAPRPFSRGLFQLLFEVFGLNEIGYNLVALFVHALNSLLVYLLVFKLVRNKLLSFLSGFFFALNSTHLQAITWIGAATGTLFAAFFALLSIVIFSKYLLENKRKFYYWSIIFLIISLGFKETSLFLFLFLPVFAYSWVHRIKISEFLKSHLLLLILGAGWILARFVPILTGGRKSPYLTAESSQGNFLFELIYNTIFYPLESLPQIFIHPQVMYKWVNDLTKVKFPSFAGDGLFEQTLGSEYLSVILAFLIIGILVFVYLHTLKNRLKERKLLVIFTVFTLMSVLPYILLPKGTAYLESRNYYLIAVGGGVLFGLTVWGIADFISRKVMRRYQKQVFYFTIFFLAIPYLWTQVNFIRQDIDTQVEAGLIRKNILNKIKNNYPAITQKTVFYTKSDSYYYGPSASVMPFQSGFGHVLLVLYAYDDKLSPQFFQEDYLWGIWDEGYKEIGDQGFGYFREYDKLLNVIRNNNLSSENVYAFEWKGKRLINITDDIREDIQTDIKRKLRKLGYM